MNFENPLSIINIFKYSNHIIIAEKEEKKNRNNVKLINTINRSNFRNCIKKKQFFLNSQLYY